MGFQKAVTWKYFPSAFYLLGFISTFISVIHFHVYICVLSFLVPVVPPVVPENMFIFTVIFLFG